MKKRILAIALACLAVFTACSAHTEISTSENTVSTNVVRENVTVSENETELYEEAEIETENLLVEILENQEPEFENLNDPALLDYVKKSVYEELVTELDSDEYFVEEVNAVYVSKEYLEELSYNSQSNIFFGYNLADIDAVYGDQKYVFTVGDDGTTQVQPFEEYDDTYEKIIKNVAIGTGVILVCVVVSVVTYGAGAPAVSMIFAASAKTGTAMALSSAAIGGVSGAIVTGMETDNPEEIFKGAMLEASEGYKWGAITGCVAGGAQEALLLKGATLNGLTMNEAARLQKETKWPVEALRALHSTEEAQIYINAGLQPLQMADGTYAFTQAIDWTFTDSKGLTNVERVRAGLAPIDATGESFELHHIGMRADSPLAILTKAQHHKKGDYAILHYMEEGKDISDSAWAAQKTKFWKSILEMAEKAGLVK